MLHFTSQNQKDKIMPQPRDEAEVRRKQAAVRRNQQILALERQGYTREDATVVYDQLMLAKDLAQVAKLSQMTGGVSPETVKESNKAALEAALKAIEVSKKYKPLGVGQILDQLAEQLRKAV